jgi:thiol-disulfide isomerase/thioredoxin
MRKYFLISIALLITSLSKSQNSNLLMEGDLAPTLSAYRWLKGTPQNTFQKGKVYVVEFGATWCSPCKAMMPVLSDLQKKYNDNLSVISVFVMEHNNNKDLASEPTYLAKVKNYVQKQDAQMNYIIAVDDPKETMKETWLTRAGKVGIPYIFIIDKENRIAWIGSNPEMLRTKLEAVINGKSQPKRAPDAPKPSFDPSTILKPKIIATSTLSYFDPGLHKSNYVMYIPTNVRPNMDEEAIRNLGKIKAYGQSLSRLYYLAYSDTLWNQILTRSPPSFDFPDTARLPHLRKSYGKYYHKPIVISKNEQLNELFNYDLEFGKSVSAEVLQKRMRDDLQSGLNYHVTVETRSVQCWILTVESLDKLEKKKSTMQEAKFELVDNEDRTTNFWNADTRDIIWMLGSNFGFGERDYGNLKVEDQGAFLDYTNVPWKFNFVFNLAGTFEETKNYLHSIGLNLSKGYKEMKVVVINDPLN